MDDKPEALRLADVPICERSITWQSQATAELRRLHEMNTDKTEIIDALCGNITELLEALKVLLNNNEALTGENIARAAIAKAEGK